MAYIFATLAAVLISVMISANGELTGVAGVYPATVLIHIVGLCVISVVTAVKRENPFRLKGVSPLLLTGGIIGVTTTLFNNLAFGHISVTSIVALSLLGQAITSLVIDQFGLMGMQRRPFNAAKLLGVTATTIGIACLLTFEQGALLAIILSLLTGVTVVVSRTINARLGERIGVMGSTWMNYATGLVTSGAVLGIGLLTGGTAMPQSLPTDIWPYMGGAIGATVIVFLNLSVTHLSSFVMTLILFAGQVFAGLAVDALTTGSWSWRSFAGGCFAVLGLTLNLWLDNRKDKKERAAARDARQGDSIPAGDPDVANHTSY